VTTADRWADKIVEVQQLRIGDLALPEHGFLRASEELFERAEALLDVAGKTRVLRAYPSARNGGRLTLLEVDAELLRTLHSDEIWRVAILDLSDADADLLRPAEYALWRALELDAGELDALLRQASTDSPQVMALLADLADGLGLELPAADPADPAGGGDAFDGQPAEGPTRTQLGEVWTIAGIHRLIVGDATDPAVVAQLLQGERPALVVTDPPYGVDYDPTWRAEAGINQNTERMGLVANDSRVDWGEVYPLFAAPVLYVWHAGKFADEVQASLAAAGYEIVAQIIWCKDRFALSRGDYHWQHEPCWYAVKNGSTHHWQGARDQATVWHIPRESVDEGEWGHGTQKPLACMLRPIQNNSAPGDLIADPFAGTGTTLIAAHRLRRRARLAEIDPRYADVILRRAEAEGLSVERELRPMVTHPPPPPAPTGSRGDSAADEGGSP
jgi:DNA modification methylase